MGWYQLIAILLAGISAISLPRPNAQAKIAIWFWCLVFLLTDVPLRLGYGPHSYDGIRFLLATASFLLILLYHHIDITRLIFLAGLCEIALITVNILCVMHIQDVIHYRHALNEAFNFMGLALLTWNWWDAGTNNGYRILYPGIFNSGRHVAPVGNLNLSVDKEKTP